MGMINVELVKYDMDKTKKRKRSNFLVEAKTEEAVIQKLEQIHKGEKVQDIHEIVWGKDQTTDKPQAQRVTGVVKFFDKEKGFGFIQPDTDMDDLFFHASALGGEEIYDGDVVEFEVGNGPKGQVAIHIQFVEED